ncbi:MAG: 30S ribosomal protein S21 [Chloroflexota bacterium]
MSDVRVGEMESLESALKRFNKQVAADGILSDARRHQYYEKPSVLRKKKAAASARKLRKAMIRAAAKAR